MLNFLQSRSRVTPEVIHLDTTSNINYPNYIQAHVHGDAWRPEDQQQNGNIDHAGRLPRRPEDTRGIPQPGAQISRQRSFENVHIIQYFN